MVKFNSDVVAPEYFPTFISPESGFSVFVVDDDEFSRQLMTLQLRKNPKVKVHPFCDGETCLESLELKPDVVLLDYHLDGYNPDVENGDVIMARIRAISPDTKVMLVTGEQKVCVAQNLSMNGGLEFDILNSS